MVVEDSKQSDILFLLYIEDRHMNVIQMGIGCSMWMLQ